MASSNTDITNSDALRNSQLALKTIKSQPSIISTTFSRLLGKAEDAREWQQYEDLLVACLKAGDEKSALAILEKLTARFGASNERVMGLRGMYQEATAHDAQDLTAVLKEYNEILKPVQKRRVALLRSIQQPEKAIEWLVELVRLNPTDVEAWSELSDLYVSVGMYSQAVFAQEEVLLSLPNAWNAHARLGEIHYIAASGHNAGKNEVELNLSSAIRRYCRSIELCDGYLRGYYGLALATEKYLELFGVGRTSSPNASAVNVEDAQRLHQRALRALHSIIEAKHAKYDEAEIEAARTFLSQRS